MPSKLSPILGWVKRNPGRTFLLIITLSCALVSAYVLRALYTSFASNGRSANIYEWGVTGDFIGGILNPVFTLINICVTAYIALLIKNAEEKRSAERYLFEIDLSLIEHRKKLQKSVSQNLHEMIEKPLSEVKEPHLLSSIDFIQANWNDVHMYFPKLESTSLWEDLYQLLTLRSRFHWEFNRRHLNQILTQDLIDTVVDPNHYLRGFFSKLDDLTSIQCGEICRYMREAVPYPRSDKLTCQIERPIQNEMLQNASKNAFEFIKSPDFKFNSPT